MMLRRLRKWWRNRRHGTTELVRLRSIVEPRRYVVTRYEAHSITQDALWSRSIAPLPPLAARRMQSSLSEPPPQCADCGTEDPSWASLNRGVLVCTDCCFVHRNLGRYISQIKSLKKSHWETGQLDLIKLLHRSGSNRIWEHALTQPQYMNSVKKPITSDPVFPTKEAFIKAKYVDQAYTIRQGKDDDPVNVEDLNRQLWSCVRAPHVDTTLRLLVLGADPNYFDPERHNTPLHVAAKEGQLLQVELLAIYGATPVVKNLAGQTPSQVAKSEGHYELGNRLTELSFEITNKLSLYLSGKKPDHQKNQHFLIPDLVGKDREELKSIRQELQRLPNEQFEKIAQDVYDEVDRRETVAAWESSREKEAKHLASEQCVAVFLPLNQSMPAMRNQQRQKLAKYSARQLASLIIDILKESKRRFLGLEPAIEEIDGVDKKMFASTNDFNRTFNSSRDYDEVAEYRASAGRGSSHVGNGIARASMGSLKSGELLDKDLSRLPSDDVLELRERLTDCETAIQMLLSTNSTLNKKIHSMQSTIDRNSADYRDLQHEFLRLNEAMNNVNMAKRMPSPAIPSSSVMSASTISMNNNNTERKMSRPSVLETSLDNRFPRRGGGMVTSPTPMMKNLPPSGRMSVDHVREREEERMTIHPNQILNNSLRIDQVFTEAGFPDNLIRETECLTTAIRQLLSDAQKGLLASVAEKHAYNIGSLISHIIELIPSDLHSQSITDTVDALASATALLSAKCNSPQLDSEETCHAAYNVAKAAKSLLVAVHD